MDTDILDLARLARRYFDAAYDMDAAIFASLFHPASHVSSVTIDGIAVKPIEAWLGVVRTLTSPRLQNLERRDEILSILVDRDIAVIKLKMQMPPRYFVDLLSCARTGEGWKIIQKVTSIESV